MKLVKAASFVLVSLLVLASFAGCSSVTKVKDTLALNDLHIQAAIAEDKGDDARALELWSEYVDRRPQSALAEYRLGRVETRLGMTQQAIGHLRIAHDLKPGNIEYIEALSEALIQANRADALMKLLEESINEGEPGSGQLRLARYAQRVGLMDEAREALLLAIAEQGKLTPAPYLAMADFMNTIGDQDGEVRYLRQALWFDASDPTILGRLESMGMIPGPSLAIEPTE
jgi:tetratricopeptide (TPR) repeat protein